MDLDGDNKTPSAIAARDTVEQLRGAVRAQLTQNQREMYDLGYLDPTASRFAVNPTTELVLEARSPEDTSAPLVTFYAQPISDNVLPVDLPKVRHWLDPNNHRYDPLPGQLFVPSGTRRGISDGVLAYSSSNGIYKRFLAIRRVGSVELGPGSVWQWPKGDQRWIIDSRKLIAQFAQLLRFLIRFGADFQRSSSWRVFINIRSSKGATLGHFAGGWAPPFEFSDETTFCIEPHVQLDLTFAGADTDIEACVLEAATRLELAFGFWKPRVYNEHTGEPELTGFTY